MKLEKSNIRGIVILVSFLIFMLWFGYGMGPGTNTRTEFYAIDLPRDQFRAQLLNVREMHPQYKVMKKKNGVLEEYPLGEDFFHIYLPSLESTVSCVVVRSDSGWGYKLGLRSISKGSNFGEWKSLNTSDLSRSENAEVKKVFETEILNRIGKWEYYRNAFKRFVGLY